jgi:hypothetical protein
MKKTLYADPTELKLSETTTFYGRQYSIPSGMADKALAIQAAWSHIKNVLELMQRGMVGDEQFTGELEKAINQCSSSFSTAERKVRRSKEKTNEAK